jgi:hypothetical protein
MFVNALRAVARWLVLAMLVPALGLQGAAPGSQRKVSDLLRQRQYLESFEVYHISDGAMYRARISLEALISSMPARDYAKISADNSFAIDSLYWGLNDTIVFDGPCEGNDVDVRWAIVLNYRDHTKEALGFNRISNCLQLLSRKAPIATTSGLVAFVDRTFGFMR